MAKRVNYFLPFIRQGITTLAEHTEVTGKRMAVPVKLTVQGSHRTDGLDHVEKEVLLFGPGDVLGIHQEVISRLTPLPDADNFESSFTPFIEFTEADFLWRFSSLQTNDKKNWIPWLSLIILKREGGKEGGEFVELPTSNKELPPQIQLKENAILPDLKETWRWAHVHLLEVEDASVGQISELIKRSPGKAVCRLLSPRKLKPQTAYQAFLVPTFKIGAEAALGIADGVEDRTLLTWETPADGAGKTVPYYYTWEFNTGTKGDFEFLIRKLKSRDLEDMGIRSMDCSNPGYGMEEKGGLELQMEAALKSLDTEFQPWGMDSTDVSDTTSTNKRDALAELLNKREEEIDGEIKLRVTPPVYGEWYASREQKREKVDPKNKEHWVEELNLDFRHRAAAGLGVRFVKENQENLMKAAWQQFSRIKKVNQELNLGRFGREVSTCMYKRLNHMKSNNLFKVALPLQNKITLEPKKTIGSFFKSSTVANNLTQIKVKKYFSKTRVSGVQSEFKRVDYNQLVSPGFKVQGMKNVQSDKALVARSFALAKIENNVWPAAIVETTKTALDPKNTIETRIKSRTHHFRNFEKVVESPEEGVEDELRPVRWYPEFHRPMYRFLRDLSQEYILPGVENVPQNTVGLLQTNRRFIEAFMIGLNHELASELRWREFPTDMRGSYFRSFWDTSIYSVDESEKEQFRDTAIGTKLLEQIQKKYGEDFDAFPKIEATYIKANGNEIEREIAEAYEAAIEKWLLTREEDKDIDKLSDWKPTSRLGDHPVPGKWNNQEEDQNQIVLLIRGELLQKYSNTLIYLVKKIDGKPDLSQSGIRTFPIFEGAMPPDIVFVGFPITPAQVADYFIVFEERMSKLRFGLDETAVGSGEKDFSWEHFQELPREGYLDGIQPTIFTQEWNDAAYVGKVMMQKQVRAAMELEELLSESN